MPPNADYFATNIKKERKKVEKKLQGLVRYGPELLDRFRLPLKNDYNREQLC